MRRLFIADVHANLPAFEAVLQAAGEVDEVIFLGDIVGFGPHPAGCVQRLQKLQARSIAGNHDLEVLEVSPESDRAREPVDWLKWTCRQLTDEQRQYLADLPPELFISTAAGQIHAIHPPPKAPYLHPAMPDAELARHLRTVQGRFVVFGHSHRRIDRLVEGRRLVCVPPVGQPRDGDPRAGYAMQIDGKLSFHRVEYDVESVVADVRAIGLDAEFTHRWVQFVRTGFDKEWSRPYRPR